jgi:Fungal specific transcription factor domain
MLNHVLPQAQQGASLNWRYHLEGAQRLITLRGGIRVLAGSKKIESLLLCFVWYVVVDKTVRFIETEKLTSHSIAVIGNTTSPASDLAMTSLHVDELDFILEQYGGGIFPFQMCPPPVFAEIIKINHLRMRATKLTGAEDLSQEAYGIQSRINGFSPEQWAESKPSSKEDWVLLGNAYQTAAVLYCISSLQSLSVLPLTSSLRARRTTYGQLLHALLNEALLSPRIKRFMLWPLIVLGMEAVNGGAAMRAFVERQLIEMSRYLGIYMPLMAKGVFERFWASGETSWDVCFDRPYIFATQIAANMKRITLTLTG